MAPRDSAKLKEIAAKPFVLRLFYHDSEGT
jgi:hypothetical protein